MRRIQFSNIANLNLGFPEVNLPKGLVHTVVIGAGGVGSYAIPQIMRTMHILGIRDITIVDGDKVELKNIERQNFSHVDIGKYKSEVIAERYGSHFGLNANYHNQFLNSPDDVRNLLKNCKIADLNFITDDEYSPFILLISCVDNISTRQHIFNMLEREPFKTSRDYGLPAELIWIDSGNTELSGQIVCKYYNRRWFTHREEAKNLGKTLFHIYPKMLRKINDAPNPAMSCANVGGGQTSIINRLVAYHLEIMVSKILYSHVDESSEFAGSYSCYELVAAHGAPVLEFANETLGNKNTIGMMYFELLKDKLNFDKFIEIITKDNKRPIGLTRKQWRENLRALYKSNNDLLKEIKIAMDRLSIDPYKLATIPIVETNPIQEVQN